jgi:NTE family protein
MGGENLAAKHPAEKEPDDQGSASDEQPSEEKPRRLFGLFGPERSLKRHFVGSPRRPGIGTLMIDAFNIMQDRITRARLAGDPPDVMVTPRLGQIGWFDFHRAQEAIDIGARATERSFDLIDEAIAALSPRPAPVTPMMK